MDNIKQFFIPEDIEIKLLSLGFNENGTILDDTNQIKYLFDQVIDWFKNTYGIKIFIEHGVNDTYDITINKLGCLRGGYKSNYIARVIAINKVLDYIKNN